MQKVTDGGSNLSGYKAVAADYAYDNNGNMTYDPSKGVTVAYNRLNLPERATFTVNDYIAYAYDASGQKLVKMASGTSSTGARRTEYSGNYLYEDKKLHVRRSFSGYFQVLICFHCC